MAPRQLNAGAQPLGREDDAGEDVVVARIAGEERAPSDVVEIRREDDRLGVDPRSPTPPCRHERLGDRPDDAAVRFEPIGIAVAPVEGLGFGGQLCQSSIDTFPQPD